jgi:hypothetical protein
LGRRNIPRALDLLDAAERAGHDPDQCAARRWSCWMLAGRFEEAWRESERIAARGRPDTHRYWDGLPFTGRRVLIRCLHGLGDTIQFLRYAPLVRAGAASVIAQTHPELVSLIRGIPGLDDVITWPDPPGGRGKLWDQQIEVMELPRAFGTMLGTIPGGIPYLRVPPGRIARSRVEPHPGARPRIGLQWGAGPWNEARSVRLTALNPILDFTRFDFYAFQRGDALSELAGLKESRRPRDVSGDSPEIVEAASDLMRIDLLITVDTMLAHLAGALGRRVWVLLPFEADWRWMLGRRDTPWYPTMTLYRQPTPGDWRSPICGMQVDLPAVLADWQAQYAD